MVSIKRIASVVPGIPLKKREREEKTEKGKRERASEEGANLCSARMGIYGPLIGGGIGSREKDQEDEDGRRARARARASEAGNIRGAHNF